jgi:p-hydroxybenzoate 3-monooxygenase
MLRRAQVVIIGAGPSGLLLSILLRREGIEALVLEKHSRDHVEARVRAGVLEQGTVDLLVQAGVSDRLMHEGLVHDGFSIACESEVHRVDLKRLAGRCMTVYGQSEIQRDLDRAQDAAGTPVLYEAQDVSLSDLSDRPRVAFTRNGKRAEIACDFIAGCDGFHGACRSSISGRALTTYERIYPFGWLGILADVKPVDDEVMYVNHSRGFALCSMRSRSRSRYYLQCSLNESVDEWSDERFWDELRQRLPESHARRLITGPSIEKSIAPLRSFVAEPMRFGRLLLVGDAAHIVPPTGAKGLNLAAADVQILHIALTEFYRSRSTKLLDEYSARALAHVWKAMRLSWWLTELTHKFDRDAFDRKLQLAEFQHLAHSHLASASLAESYAGGR